MSNPEYPRPASSFDQAATAAEYLDVALEHFRPFGRQPEAMHPDFSNLESNPEFKVRFAALAQAHIDTLAAAADEFIIDGIDVDGKYFSVMIESATLSQQEISDLCQELGVPDADMWSHFETLMGVNFINRKRQVNV